MLRNLACAALLAAAVSSLPAQYRFQTYVSGLSSALYVTHAPDDAGRIFVVQQSGLIRVVRDGQLLPTPFLNIASTITSGGERGLLGLAFRPDYARSGKFVVSYTRRGDAASILAEYSVSATNPDVADPNSGQVLYGPITQPFSNHNGGCIQFGPDGYLYLGLGDGGSGGDPRCYAQNRQIQLGKMLRLDVTTVPASIPPTNPFVNDSSTLDEIWALGLRNPWRFSFDRETGDLYIADVGQGAWEEINAVPASSTGGENYGWKMMEGNVCYGTSACPTGSFPPCNSPVLTDPIQVYSHSFGCSVTGGYVYRGCAIPSLQGTYWYGDYCTGRIWSLQYQNGQAVNWQERTAQVGTLRNLTSFGEDSEGELYAVSSSGTIYRLESTVNVANDLGFGTAGGNGMIPTFSVCGVTTTGESLEYRLDGAAANAACAFLVGPTNNPTTIPPFGIVVPNPSQFSVAFMTDADGKVRFRIPGGLGAATAYAQWAVVDNGGPGGIALSNALEIFLF